VLFTAKQARDKKSQARLNEQLERLLKNASGKEQSGEYFTLTSASTNINLFQRQDEHQSEDFDMSLVASMFMEDSQQSISEASLYIAKAARDERTPRNSSTASSTVDGEHAVGVPAGNEEQTISTQLALRELSIMFSSPAFALKYESRRAERSGGLGFTLNESGVSESGHARTTRDTVSRGIWFSDLQRRRRVPSNGYE